MATIKQTDAEGNEVDVEVFSQAEVDAQLLAKEGELKNTYETQLKEKEDSLKAIQTEKEQLETKLGVTKEDNPNFKILKEALTKKDNEIKAINEKFDTTEKLRKTEELNLKLSAVSKGNVELEKKMKLQLSTTLAGMKEDTKEDRDKKIEAAFKLSVDTSSDGPGMFDMGVGGGNYGGDFKDTTVDNGFTSREKALGAKMGITAEDYKKYGPKVSKK